MNSFVLNATGDHAHRLSSKTKEVAPYKKYKDRY